MVTQGSASRAAHRLAILLTPDRKRFLICVVCQVLFPFPWNESYEAASSQFDSQVCTPANQDRFFLAVWKDKLDHYGTSAKSVGTGAGGP